MTTEKEISMDKLPPDDVQAIVNEFGPQLRLNDTHQAENSSLKRKTVSTSGDISPRCKRLKNDVQLSTNPCQSMEVSEGTKSADSDSETRRVLGTVDVSGYFNVGPLPPMGSSIFKGKKFIIVTAPKIDLGSLSELLPTKKEGTRFFSKIQLVKQICMGGGRIINDFTQVNWLALAKNIEPDIFLIAESHVNTKLYLKAVTSGLPCVCHHWIIECCEQKSLVKYSPHLLATGHSLLTDNLYPWHGKRKILSGYYFAIKSLYGKSADYNFWKDILVLAGGTIITPDNLNYPKERSVVVAIDDHYPEDEIRDLSGIKTRIATKNWVVECIVTGCNIPLGVHSNFTFKKLSPRYEW